MLNMNGKINKTATLTTKKARNIYRILFPDGMLLRVFFSLSLSFSLYLINRQRIVWFCDFFQLILDNNGICKESATKML